MNDSLKWQPRRGSCGDAGGWDFGRAGRSLATNRPVREWTDDNPRSVPGTNSRQGR
jgi:hypothetical protein